MKTLFAIPLLAFLAAAQENPEFAPIQDVPGLPRVLLIGDSISMGYTLPVRELLQGKANVHRIPTNGGPTINGLKHIDEWVAGKWDVIHFNFGLHDLKINPDGSRQVPIGQYGENLRVIVERLNRTGARLIWATTTPVPDAKVDPPRVSADVIAYNAVARRVMEEKGVATDDLYALVLPRLKELQRPANVHFTPEGYSVLAERVAAAIAAELPREAPRAAASCESLASLAFSDAKITLAQPVRAGAFSPPGAAPAAVYKRVPEFCRVAATLTPTSDSDIRIEVWLPVAGWNRKFQAVGNGGWAGTISYGAMAEAAAAGYATASTDTGHATPGGSFVLGHPEKLVDFAWRSEHEMTVKAKAIVQAFYGVPARRSYWVGCSTGGRQALKAAQMFPEDFDGIVAGAPANRTAMALWAAHAVLKDPASFIPPHKYPVIHKAALDACDAQDGVKDGLIEDPARCRFDPGVLLCKDGSGPDCLTAPQVAAARKMYSPPKDPRTGRELFGGLSPGSELEWGVLARGPEPYGPILDQLKYVVFKDPAWDWRRFDFDRDMERFEQPGNLIMNATDPNLAKFAARGGKLLIYHGWNDANISPYNTIRYFRSVRDTLGSGAASNVRLFMAPGMGHCGGGEGCNAFEKVGTLDRWVEEGAAPERIVASRAAGGKIERTRPLCAYPQVARYKGAGSIDDEASFACVLP